MTTDQHSYRDNFGAALAQLDSLKPVKTSVATVLPSKKELFIQLKKLFFQEPERWLRTPIRWAANGYPDSRDGWILDGHFPKGISIIKETLGFYRTGFFWIRIGKVQVTFDSKSIISRVDKIDRINWVFIFCPLFRRAARKRRNWLLLKGFGSLNKNQ
jgi:hypothetical protein